MNVFMFLILVFTSVNIFAKCQTCRVKFAQIHPQARSTSYSANLEDGTLVHVSETKPVAATISGKKIVTKTVQGKMQMSEEQLYEEDAKMYMQAIKKEAGTSNY